MKLSIGLMKRKRTCANYLLVQNRTQNMAVVLNTMTSQEIHIIFPVARQLPNNF